MNKLIYVYTYITLIYCFILFIPKETNQKTNLLSLLNLTFSLISAIIEYKENAEQQIIFFHVL